MTRTSTRSSTRAAVHDETLEQAVLGAILLDPDSYYEVSELLSERSFYLASHALVWRAITELQASRTPVDTITLRAHLEQSGQLKRCGGVTALVEIADSTLSAANVYAHATLLVQMEKRRRLQQVTSMAMEQLHGDPDQVAGALQSALLEIGEIGSGPLQTTAEQIEQMIRLDREVLEGKTTGLSWPIPALTSVTRGIRQGRLYFIVGLFKSGKSKFATATINQIITHDGVPVLFISMEMPARQVFHWLASSALRIDSKHYDSPRLSERQMSDSHDWVRANLGQGQIHVNQSAVQTPESICAAMRRAVLRDGVKAVFIDYIQKVTWSASTPSLMDISRGMNAIASTAKSLSVPVIALSQVPKTVDKNPAGQLISLADVKDAAVFAEAADCGICITDPNRHKQTPEGGMRPFTFLVEQRDGPTKTIEVQVDLRFGHIFESTPEESPLQQSRR